MKNHEQKKASMAEMETHRIMEFRKAIEGAAALDKYRPRTATRSQKKGSASYITRWLF